MMQQKIADRLRNVTTGSSCLEIAQMARCRNVATPGSGKWLGVKMLRQQVVNSGRKVAT